MANSFLVATVALRILYVLGIVSFHMLDFVGLEQWCHGYNMIGMFFGLDITPFSLILSSLTIDFTISNTFEGLCDYILPVLHADEAILDTNIVHSIVADNTRGGMLLQQLLVHIHSQEKLGLPLSLTSARINASHQLIAMLNCLPLGNSSNCTGDNLL